MSPYAWLCVMLLVQAGAVNANESDRPANTARDAYYRALRDADFGYLEREAQLARAERIVLVDGQPKLASLYAGVSGCLTSGCSNALSPEEWSNRLDRLKKWNATFPDSITAKVALATYPLEYGWSIRGQGYAATVPDAANDRFRALVLDAGSQLEAIAAVGKGCPGWYVSMLRVGRSLGWPRQEFDSLYEEARRAFPWYLPIYFEMASYLAPRWYGSRSEFSRYVERAVQSAPPELSDVLYARLNWLMWTRTMFTDGQADWWTVKASFEKLMTQHPHDWNLNNYARFACLAKDAATIERLRPEVKRHPIPDAWGSLEYFDYCINVH